MKLKLMILTILILNCGIKSVKEGEEKIKQKFLDTAKDSKQVKAATLLVHSDKMNLHITSSYGFIEKDEVKTNQPFHIASVGKLFTAALILQLVDNGKLKLETPIQAILEAETLKDLFVLEGKNYSDKVTIEHLLTHTSGVEDYFESLDKKNKSVIEEITKDPNRFWTPKDLLDFTRTYQKAVAIPGDKFHYSDTGYILLGLILEKLSGKSYELLLLDNIFTPLGMKDSYVHLRSKPIESSNLRISTMMLGDKNVTDYQSVSADWAGGGIISTTEDLLLFHKAFITGKLFRSQNYLSMKGENVFMPGIFYGLGLMTVRFGEMSFFIPQTPSIYGHSGLLSTQLFYSPDYDAYIIANLGSTDDVGSSFEMMFWIMNTLKEIDLLGKK